MNDIYLKIKSIRLKKNLTQEDVAKRLGMAQSNYARMERGLTSITIERLEELAGILEMSPEAIMTFTDSEDLDFKEDAQYYLNQVKRLETKVQKLEREASDRSEDDENIYSHLSNENKKLNDKLNAMKKELAVKDESIKDMRRIVERLEREAEEKGKSIEYLQQANIKLLEMLSK